MTTKKEKVNILGEVWEVIEGTEAEFPGLKDNDGYTDSSVRRMVIDDMTKTAGDPIAKADMDAYKRQVIRHEVVHAFLEESGLSSSSGGTAHWAENEEMVDWIAIQAPKMCKAFVDLEIL